MVHPNREATMKTCAQRGEFCARTVIGYSMTQIEAFVYRRYLLRQCVNCGDKDAQLVHWVNPDQPLCEDCFGQNMQTTCDIDGNVLETVCKTCKKPTVRITIKEPQDGSV